MRRVGMANKYRGEISAIINGEQRTLCLTLGALAELESDLGATDMMALAQRFAQGRIATRDLIAILGAGLRGGGNAVSNDDVAQFALHDGLAHYINVVAALLQATFGGEDAPANP